MLSLTFRIPVYLRTLIDVKLLLFFATGQREVSRYIANKCRMNADNIKNLIWDVKLKKHQFGVVRKLYIHPGYTVQLKKI